MMIPISDKTENLIEKLYQSENEREQVKSVLVNQCADNLPFCDKSTPDKMERIRFSVLKLTVEKGDLNQWIKLAQTDWRDLFMAAGFGQDADAHNKWAERIIGV